jgi:hypothetical protein
LVNVPSALRAMVRVLKNRGQAGTRDRAAGFTYVKRHGADVEQHYYRKKALDCLAAAETVREPGERLRLLHIAQLFLRLAIHVRTRLDRGTPHRLPERQAEQGVRDDT